MRYHDAVKEEREDGEVVAVEIGRDLVEVPARLLRELLDRHVALGGERSGELLDVVRVEHHLPHLALRPECRTPHQPLLTVEEDLQRPRQPPDDAILALVPILGS